MTLDQCPRTNAWFRACKFEPRYDLSPLTNQSDRDIKFRGSTALGEALLAAHRQKNYVHDICVRCGRIVERTRLS